MSAYYDNGIARLYQGDCRAMPLRDAAVHCAVTSPPYYGLRVYADLPGSDWADGWHGCLGNEPTVEQYLPHMLECFQEVWRVLRPDAVLWVNIGDTRGGGRGGEGQQGATNGGTPNLPTMPNTLNLLGIPERFALAMQADGWMWRDTVIWAKKSAMPESLSGTRWERCRVRLKEAIEHRRDPQVKASLPHPDNGIKAEQAQWADCPGCAKCEDNDGLVLRRGSWRCTSAFEYIYMFVKGPGYYSDGDAVKTAAEYGYRDGGFRGGGGYVNNQAKEGIITKRAGTVGGKYGGTANRRNVWTDISPEPYGGAHFATFPSDLPRLCIQASTSEKGCCPECGAQWARVVRVVPSTARDEGNGWQEGRVSAGHHGPSRPGSFDDARSETLGWRATCEHGNLVPIPATVLDPFAGTFTTGVAAQRLGRHAVGMEMSEEYLQQAVRRLTGVTLPMI